MVPAISVIITAHNRKKFIVDAISSVLNQTLQKSFYEIIVVKNFEDKTIDNFIYRNNIKDIYLSEEPIGPKYVKGIQNSTGEITCILEDDDKFKVDKLQKVYNKFKNQQLGFYHNNFELINESGNLMKSKFYNNYEGPTLYIKNSEKNKYYKEIVNHDQIFRNSSSICFRRQLVEDRMSSLKQMRISPDYFLMMLAMDSNLDLLFDNEILTQYRFHTENMSIIKKSNFNQYLSNLIQYYSNLIEDNNVLMRSLNKKYLIDATRFKSFLFEIEVTAFNQLLGKKQKENKTVGYENILFLFKKSIEMRYKHGFISLFLYLAPIFIKRRIMETSYRRSLER